MSNIPENLKYTKEHEWIRVKDNDTAIIGITDYAQENLGDVTFVELPEVDQSFDIGESFGVVESVKTASDLYLPVSGSIVEINQSIEDTPENINTDPYGDGWLIKIKISNLTDLENLLSASDYQKII